MKILHEMNQLELGGVEEMIRCLVKYDKKNEYEIMSYKDGAMRKMLEDAGAKVTLHNDKAMSDIECHLIHIHCGGDKSPMLRFLNGVPVIETIHSIVVSPNDEKKIKKRVGNSNFVAGINKNCNVIHNGIDFDILQPTKSVKEIKNDLGIDDNDIVVGRLSRLGNDKMVQEYLITCWELQKKGYPVVPVIVGKEALYETDYVAKLKLLVESVGLKNVRWVGEKYDKGNYYQIFDYFLYPSILEGFGLVFVEALYFNLPVITYKTPVAEEVMKDYGIYTEHNISALTLALEKAIKSQKKETKWVNFDDRNSKDFVLENYSAEKMTEKYKEIYASVL